MTNELSQSYSKATPMWCMAHTPLRFHATQANTRHSPSMRANTKYIMWVLISFMSNSAKNFKED